MSQLVAILKGGDKEKNIVGAVLADKAAPPFVERRDGHRLRWLGADHPASVRIRALVEKVGKQEPGGDGLCPARVWCHTKRLKISKHAIPSFQCGFEQHHCLWQCGESGDGHERVLDRGDVTALCAGATFCGDASCHHASPHRWDPLAGCHAVKCRRLETMAWDEETRGERPDPVVVCERVDVGEGYERSNP